MRNIYLAYLILLISCNSYKENTDSEFTLNDCIGSELKELSYIVEDSFTLNADSVNYKFATTFIKKADGQILYYGFNQSEQALYIFNFSNGDLLKKMNLLEIEGFYERMDPVKEVFIQSKDSIYLNLTDDNDVILINNKGKILDRWKITSTQYFNTAFNGIEYFPDARKSDPFIYDETTNSFYLRSYPSFGFYIDYEFYKYNYKIAYNLGKDTIDNFFGIYPEEFRNKNEFFTNDHIFDFKIVPNSNGNRYFLSYRRSHCIYEIDINSNKIINQFSAKSNYLNDFELIKRDAPLYPELMNHFSSSGFYQYLLYNPYNFNLYRVVKHNSDLHDMDGNMISTNNKSFSVIKLDNNLKAIGEAHFKGGLYQPLEILPSMQNDIILRRIPQSEDEIVLEDIKFKQ